MTYDERQEIDQYLGIIKNDAERVIRSVDMLKEAIDKKQCVVDDSKVIDSTKDKFLKQY